MAPANTPSAPAGDLFEAPAAPASHVRVGIGGWTFAPWRDNFYPAGLVQRRELEFASRRLGAIEVNGTYYRAQKPATYASWRAQTPEGFVFSLKAPRRCVEEARLADAARLAQDFVTGGLAELGDRLGPILWQFGPTRRFDRDDLAAFLDSLPRTLDGRPLRHVLEVRHPSFACAGYLELARSHDCATVFTDAEKFPSFADVTGAFVYARLMRSRDIPDGYPAAELDHWAACARSWAEGLDPPDLPRLQPDRASGAAPREVFIFFIGSAKQRNPAAAEGLIARLP